MKKEKSTLEGIKIILSDIVFSIAESSRANMIDTILRYSQEEYESIEDMKQLAKLTDEQLRYTLRSIYSYYLNDI
jgi:hypothetical protein